MKNKTIKLFKPFFFLSLFFALTCTIYSKENNLRNCMLLPVEDSFKDTISFKVFLEIENYLKESNWCYYKYNSEILNILGNYKNNLSIHLRNKNVLKLVSDKTKSGSLIKINIFKKNKGVRLRLIVYGSNGTDILFDETEDTNELDINKINLILKNWLNLYSKEIPYDGKIIGVLGDQFTIDMGNEIGLIEGSLVKIIRPTIKRKHPLLKRIVDWETKEIGSAKIFLSNDLSSQGKVYDYEPKQKLKIGDWIIIDKKKDFSKTRIDNDFNIRPKRENFNFGRLGQFGILLSFGAGSGTSNESSQNLKKIGGALLGIDSNLELWFTRNFWFELNYGKSFGSFEKEEGSFSPITSNSSFSQFKLKFGYKYLPLGFYYGPQIDGYLGFGNYSYSIDHLPTVGLTPVTSSGFLMGLRGNMPIIEDLRGFIAFDFLLGSSFTEETSLNGKVKSSSHFHLSIGGDYKFAKNIKLLAAFSMDSSNGTYSETTNAKFKQSALKFGVNFSF